VIKAVILSPEKRKPIKAYGEADRWRLALKKKADKRK
jgi:hypothetical protein